MRGVLLHRRALTPFSSSPPPPPTFDPGAADHFNRANENPLNVSSYGRTWQHPTSARFRLVSSKAVAAIGGAFSYMESDLADATTSVDMTFQQVGAETGLVFRMVDVDNFWVLILYSDLMYLLRFVAGVSTTIGGTPAYTGGVGVTVSTKVIYTGSSIKTYVNDVLKHDVVDTTHQTATKVGLYTGFFASDTVSQYDNFNCAVTVAASQAFKVRSSTLRSGAKLRG